MSTEAKRIAEAIARELGLTGKRRQEAEDLIYRLVGAHLPQWQGIESAPKDGTAVLLWWPYWRKEPVIGRYQKGEWQSEVKLWDYGTGAPEDVDEASPQGWQPLPSPPKGVRENGTNL